MDEITDFFSLKYTSLKSKNNSTLLESDQIFRNEGVENNSVNSFERGNDSYFIKEKINFLGEFIGVPNKEVSFSNEPDCISENPQSSEISNTHSISYDNDVIFQNWVENVVQKESETDKYLEELKKEHGLTNYNLTDNSKIVSSLSWTDEDKIPNISEIDLDRLFTNPSEHIHSVENKKQVVQNADRSASTTSMRKNLKQSQPKIKPKYKSFPKSNSGGKAFDQTVCDRDVDSWISSESSRTSDLNKRNKSAYYDILKNLEEIETQTAPENGEFRKDLEQHDEMGKSSRSESIDDIVSILEVLENENKKSRK